jgi:hypothetical protein
LKTLQTTIAILLVSIFALSCSKDDEAISPEQNPLTGFLEQTGFNQKELLRIDNPNFIEIGLAFIPLVNGKITAVVVKLPVKKLDVRVTIWDKVTESVLWTETIDITTANAEITKAITPLSLTKDKEYIISFNVTDCFRRRNTAGLEVAYPFTIGDIKITSFNYKGGSAQDMPTNTDSLEYLGDCSFKFQK